MITTVTCEQCGTKFTGWFTRRFCDECKRLKRIECSRKWNAAHRDDADYLEKRRASARRYAVAHREESAERCRQWRKAHPDYSKQWHARKKKEAQAC